MGRLPGTAETASIFTGVDVTKQPIPVLPTVHYCMRGVPTNWKGQVLDVDPSTGAESMVNGLYAAGVIACVPVHGAYHLGAKSLLDIVVFGRAAAGHTAENHEKAMPFLRSGGSVSPEIGVEGFIGLEELSRNADGSTMTSDLRVRHAEGYAD